MLRTPRQQSQIANQLKFVDPKVSIISCIDNLPKQHRFRLLFSHHQKRVCYKTSELWTSEKSGSKKEIRAAEE